MRTKPADDSHLGQKYFYGAGCRKNYLLALPHLQRAAEKGDAHCQNLIGYMHDLGLAMESNRREAAR